MSTYPDNDFNGRAYKTRALTPAQTQVVAAALGSGATPRALADAYGVSVRTIYRAREYGRHEWQRVVVGDWAAEFVITEYGPARCTAWVPADPRGDEVE